MGLFDLFSNDTAVQAAGQRNTGLQQGYDVLSQNFGQGRNALATNLQTGRADLAGNLNLGRDVLSSNFAQGRADLAGNLSQGRDVLSSDFSRARDALSGGAATATGLYKGLGDYFTQQYGGGANAYGDATGANGVAGVDRARTNFQSDPGYGFQLDQGLKALQRTHAAAGNLSSGNADADTLKFSQGLADQSYGNYVQRLAPYLPLAGSGQTTATAGQAGATTGLASGLSNVFQNEGTGVNASFGTQGAGANASYQGQGGANAASYGAQGQGFNTSYGAEGAGTNASFQGQGQAANTNYTGQGASNAAATMNNYNIGQNQMNALVSAGKLGASLFGGFG